MSRSTGTDLTVAGHIGGIPIPKTFTDAGEQAVKRLLQFFVAEIRNPNTRQAYARAILRFDGWCQKNRVALTALTPFHVAAYIEELGTSLAKPSTKQHLAAIRMLFNYLVVGQIIPSNAAAAVRGPKYVVKVGKTPVLTADEMRLLLDSIETDTAIGLRDRALIATMCYSFARISAVLAMDVGDFYQQGLRSWIRLHEKGGKDHAVPTHHVLEEYLDAYLRLTAIDRQAPGLPLFRSIDRKRQLSDDRLERREALAMIKRRALKAGLGAGICNHSFRATGITNYLENGGTVEKAQQIACHESPRTTKLYDRTSDQVTLAEIERIRF